MNVCHMWYCMCSIVMLIFVILDMIMTIQLFSFIIFSTKSFDIDLLQNVECNYKIKNILAAVVFFPYILLL